MGKENEHSEELPEWLPKYVEGDKFEQVFEQEMTQWIIPASAGRPLRKPGANDCTFNIKQPDRGNELVGLAISGGGIRAATFALGVTQAMARYGVFDRVDYMSTVSGGGYFGSALSSLLHHRATNTQEAGNTPPGRPLDRDSFPFAFDATVSVFKAEAPTVRHLREYSNYLAPRLGLFDTQTWHSILRLLAFQILNLVSLALPPLALLLSTLALVPDIWWDRNEPLTKTPWVIWTPAVLAVLSLLLFSATALVLNPIRATAAKNWLERLLDSAQRPLLISVLASASVLGFIGLVREYRILHDHVGESVEKALSAGMIGYLIMAVRTVMGVLGRSQGSRPPSKVTGLIGMISPFIFGLIGYFILVLILLNLFHFLEHMDDLVQLVVMAATGIWTAMLLFTNRIPLSVLNDWTPNTFYRQCLSEAYLQRETADDIDGGADVSLSDLQHLPFLSPLEVVRLLRNGHDVNGSMTGRTPQGPYHILDGALNTSGSTDIEFLGRKSDSFFFSHLYAGSALTGFVATKKYPDVTLGTAMAVSGAAVSPNMGARTSTLLAILLTLLNARLGYWLHNPRHFGPPAKLLGGWSPLVYYLKEMFVARPAVTTSIYM